jgi:hypothetical protein
MPSGLLWRPKRVVNDAQPMTEEGLVLLARRLQDLAK